MSLTLGDPNRHYWLMQRMLKRTGTDAVTPFAEGDLTAQDWAGLVQTCRGCDNAQGCRKWLEALVPAAEDAPAFCANRKRFAALRETARQVA